MAPTPFRSTLKLIQVAALTLTVRPVRREAARRCASSRTGWCGTHRPRGDRRLPGLPTDMTGVMDAWEEGIADAR
jgi:hypothetical protein